MPSLRVTGSSDSAASSIGQAGVTAKQGTPLIYLAQSTAILLLKSPLPSWPPPQPTSVPLPPFRVVGMGHLSLVRFDVCVLKAPNNAVGPLS